MAQHPKQRQCIKLVNKRHWGAMLSTLLLCGSATAAQPGIAGLDAIYPALDALYRDLHQHPEISFQEEKTAAKIAGQLRAAGLDVTERVGGFGVVGVLRNGTGPTLLVRTDIDALPMPEQTGLPYASKVTTRDLKGVSVPVAHACGHDLHMSAWVGAATLLARSKDKWKGTLVFVGQPAEEVLQGARLMIKDGLFTRFPRPDMVLGLHTSTLLPSGQVGVVSGPASAASNSIDITFYGKGSHGAAPHMGIDPLLIAARAVVTLQTIVSRENSPFDPAVVTVGTFHAGTKRNIISDEAKMELTVRSYNADVQKRMLASIARIAKAEAMAAGAAREPAVVNLADEASEVVINSPAMATQLLASLRRDMGQQNVMPIGPVSSSEDFGVYGTEAGAPSLQLRIGTVEPTLFARSKSGGASVIGTHNPTYAPDREPSLRTAVSALTYSALELLARPLK